MASILNVMRGGGTPSTLGGALFQTAQNFRTNSVRPGHTYSGATFGGGQQTNQLPFDPSMGRGGSVTTAAEMQPFSNSGGVRPTVFGNRIAAWTGSNVRQNLQPLTSFMNSRREGNTNGSMVFNPPTAGGSVAPGANAGMDADTLYRVFGISPSTTGYRTPLASLIPAARGESLPMQIYRDYASGPQRESFSSRFGHLA